MPSSAWRLLIVACLLSPAAGCLDAATDGSAGGVAAPTALDPALAVGQDRPLLDERVRAREIDVATDPNDPDHLAAVMMVPWPTQEAVAPYDSMQWTGLALSHDGGATWEYQALPGYPGDTRPNPWGEGTWALGDAVLGFMPDGSLVMGLLPIRVPVQISMSVAVFPWGSFTPSFVTEIAKGAVGVDGQHDVPTSQVGPHVDKDQILVDPTTGDIYVGYSERWQQTSEARAMFTKSVDGGRTFTEPIPIDPPQPHYIGSGQHQLGTWPLLTDDGRLLVFFGELQSGTLFVSESPDHGDTFAPPRTVFQHDGVFLVSVTIDQTGGPHDGTLYVTGTDDRNGDGDVFLAVSRNGGETWEDELRVNQDALGNGREQRMPEIVVEPDGAVAIVYMAQVAGADDWQAFVARSIDGGRTVTEYKVSSASTDPACFNNQPGFLTHLGDYLGISYNNDGVVAVWQDGRNCTTEMPYSEAWMVHLPTRAR